MLNFIHIWKTVPHQYANGEHISICPIVLPPSVLDGGTDLIDLEFDRK
jgi:hypothetical protein